MRVSKTDLKTPKVKITAGNFDEAFVSSYKNSRFDVQSRTKRSIERQAVAKYTAKINKHRKYKPCSHYASNVKIN